MAKVEGSRNAGRKPSAAPRWPMAPVAAFSLWSNTLSMKRFTRHLQAMAYPSFIGPEGLVVIASLRRFLISGETGHSGGRRLPICVTQCGGGGAAGIQMKRKERQRERI